MSENPTNQNQNKVHFEEFEKLKQLAKNGNEYWSARDLLPLLGYSSWQRFQEVLHRAMAACAETNNVVDDHFNASVKMVVIGSGATRRVADYNLSRFGAYLIAQNSDPRSRPEVASAQVYFAVQTRRAELADLLAAQNRRLNFREQISEGNKRLNETAQQAGVTSETFGIFHDAGYEGLYDGLNVAQIKDLKGIDEKEDILDRMGFEELTANGFRIAQAEAKLRRENVQGAEAATQTHREVGRNVREFIQEQGNTMPENIPPEPSIKPLLDERKRKRKKLEASQNQVSNGDNDSPKQGSLW